MATWTDGCNATRFPGIYKTKTGYRVRVRAVDPRTGTLKEVNRLFEGVSLGEALARRQDLLDEARQGAVPTAQTRVGDFAKLWIASKAVTLDPNSCNVYIEALEKHVLPAFGRFIYAALRPADVQAWVNRCLQAKSPKGKPYSVLTVRKWFRTFRTMTRDAIAQLDLPRDPTARVTFPEPGEREGSNALTPDELARFLAAMREKYPRNYALTALLALTGLRFCHASALKWEDIDEARGVVRIARKNFRGHIGPVSRKKRAPREIPLLPELAAAFRAHRQSMLEGQEPGFESGWMFPSEAGALREPSSLRKAWQGSLKAAKIDRYFTVHGLRRTFNDLARRAGIDAVITRSITGHVTEQMREHYSTVGLDEKQDAVEKVAKLIKWGSDPRREERKSGDSSGDSSSKRGVSA